MPEIRFAFRLSLYHLKQCKVARASTITSEARMTAHTMFGSRQNGELMSVTLHRSSS